MSKTFFLEENWIYMNPNTGNMDTGLGWENDFFGDFFEQKERADTSESRSLWKELGGWNLECVNENIRNHQLLKILDKLMEEEDYENIILKSGSTDWDIDNLYDTIKENAIFYPKEDELIDRYVLFDGKIYYTENGMIPSIPEYTIVYEKNIIKAMIYKTNGGVEPIELIRGERLSQLQKYVGGTIDIIDLISSKDEEEGNYNLGFDLVINDEGIINNLDFNPWSNFLTKGTKWEGQIFYGDVVFIQGRLL